jgi:hypothetical protein
VSFSWIDPHFAALYARREEERLAERLTFCAGSKSAEADFDRVKTPEGAASRPAGSVEGVPHIDI